MMLLVLIEKLPLNYEKVLNFWSKGAICRKLGVPFNYTVSVKKVMILSLDR